MNKFLVILLLLLTLGVSSVKANAVKPGSLKFVVPKIPNQKDEVKEAYNSYVKELASSKNLKEYCNVVKKYGSNKNQTQQIFIKYLADFEGQKAEKQVFTGLKYSAVESYKECKPMKVEMKKNYTAILITSCFNSMRFKKELGVWKVYPDTTPFYKY